MANIRTQSIRVRNCGTSPCCVCGKDTAKRIGARPAPVMMILRVLSFFEAKYKEPVCVGGQLCLGCAKRLASRLDAVIDQIESQYK